MPELSVPPLRMTLADREPGRFPLVKQVDRLSRLTLTGWLRWPAKIGASQVRVSAPDLPTAWCLAVLADTFTARALAALNAVMPDVLVAVAREDTDRRSRLRDTRDIRDEGVAELRDLGGAGIKNGVELRSTISHDASSGDGSGSRSATPAHSRASGTRSQPSASTASTPSSTSPSPSEQY